MCFELFAPACVQSSGGISPINIYILVNRRSTRREAIIMKHIGAAILIFSGFLMTSDMAAGAESAVPEPFQGYDNGSRYSIRYDDLSDLLRTVVVNTGRSSRAIGRQSQEITGTRMKPKVNRFTDGEGNQFHYEAFMDNEAGRQFLRKIQVSLQQAPTETPLEKFSRNEQLAYWLNLYNVTVLNEIIAVYPKRSLKNFLLGGNAILSKKLLTVSGVSLSLDDIQYTILKQNYDDNPLIMYGLYQGNVGGPNIRPSAYTGADVYLALEDNAAEFINSNRGTFAGDEGILRVSSLYDRNSAYFPDFESDLSQHLLKYLEGDVRVHLQTANTFNPDINDWTVTDLGGTRHEVGGSLANNNAALLDAYRGNRRNIDGSVRVATLEVKRTKKKPEEDPDTIENMERFPVEGASIEEVATEEIQPADENIDRR